jgi:hypothetical protein
MKNIRFLPFLILLISLGLSELLFVAPKTIYYLAIPLGNLALIASVFAISWKKAELADFFRHLILPLSFFNGAIFYGIMLNELVAHLVFLVGAGLQFYYLRFLYLYLHKPYAYAPTSIENIAIYGSFVSVFWATATIYGLQSFINLPVWMLVTGISLVFSLLVYQIFWSNKIDEARFAVYVMLITLVLAEISWVASFLPFDFSVIGFIVAICYYMSTGLARLYLLERLEKRHVKAYLSYGFLSILAIILTSQWI